MEYKDVRSFEEAVIKRVRPGVADDSHKYGDRFRNWLERLVQRVAARRADLEGQQLGVPRERLESCQQVSGVMRPG